LRGAAEDIAATPEGLAALQRFNAGDELGALLALDRLRDARGRARQVRNNIESAAEARNIAALALEARRRGQIGTNAVISRYEETTRLDPSEIWDWVNLGRLYQDAGRLRDALRAAEIAVESANEDELRSVAMSDSADALMLLGELQRARALYEQTLAIDRRLAAESPSDNSLARNVALGLSSLGQLSLRLGDAQAALIFFDEALELDAKRWSLSQYGLDWFDLCVTAMELGDAYVAAANLDQARFYFERSIDLFETIPPGELLVEVQVQFAVVRWKLAAVRAAAGDIRYARSEYGELVTLANALLEQDPTNQLNVLEVQRLRLSHADMAILSENWSEARQVLEQVRTTLESIASSGQLSVAAQNYLWLVQVREAMLPGTQMNWATLASGFNATRAQGPLSALDYQFIERIRGHASQDSRRPPSTTEGSQHTPPK